MIRLVDQVEQELQDPETREQYLLLSHHPEFVDHWLVEGFSDEFLLDLDVGSYRTVHTPTLPQFLVAADEAGYRVAFFDDPTDDLAALRHLDAEPDVSLRSEFPNTIQGFLPYQLRGYNYLKDRDYGFAAWDTGTGKTVLSSALIKHHDFDLCLFVVKKNNKVNTVRKLKQLADIDAVLLTGTPATRQNIWDSIQPGAVVVMNYEAFKTDLVNKVEKRFERSAITARLIEDKRVMVIFDEMPTKLKNRDAQLYRAVTKTLYRTAPPQVDRNKLVPAHLRAYMLTATPIENNPEDFFNCERILSGGQTYGTVGQFHSSYVSSWNFFNPDKPETFHDLERMRLKARPFTHQVKKTDPDVAAVFPKVIDETVYIDWPEKLGAVYTEIEALARHEIEGVDLGTVPIFSLIANLQMVCDAPQMINDSAARRAAFEDARQLAAAIGDTAAPSGSEFALKLPESLRKRLTNADHPKLERLREILTEDHPDASVAIYSRFNAILMPYLGKALDEWGVSWGRYHGSDRQKQAVQDAFQAGAIRVFLASDAASDSLDLDTGNVVIDYNLPWKWTTLEQRHNRVHRPTSTHATVYYYSLVMENSVEERTLQIIARKHGFHEALLGSEACGMQLDASDLKYILSGKE